MTPDSARWLLSVEAEPVLRESAGLQAMPAAIEALRRRVGDADRAAAVIEQVALRQRARAKFPEAERLFFTRKGLEQATDAWIARYKAARLAGIGRVVDVCCGVGGDLMGLAARGDTLGVDADPVTALFAERNSGAKVLAEKLGADDLPDCDAWHADPDRRPGGRRTSQPDQHEPSLDVLAAWRQRTPAAAIKLAPAARLPDAWEADCELEWISRGGECRQLVAWCGPLARRPGERSATRLASDDTATTFVGRPALPCPVAPELGAFLHEPDPAVLAADLVGAIAEQHALAGATPQAAYLTSDTPVDDPLVASFRVEEVMPLDRKRLAGWLAQRNVGRLEIKCRGVDLLPEKLRKELKPRGENAATLLIFPDARRKTRVAITERQEPTKNSNCE